MRRRPSALSGRCSASASSTVCARQTNMPEFQTYSPDARYPWAVSRSGFSRKDAASAAPATSVGAPFCT